MVRLVKDKDKLRIELTEDGREHFRYRDGSHKSDEEVFWELLECELSNGWDLVNPEDIGALTASPILSDETEYDDCGNLVSVGSVYWRPDYALTSEVEELQERGFVEFSRA